MRLRRTGQKKLRPLTLLGVAALLAGCTGGPCNPPPILYPILLPIGLIEKIKHAKQDAYLPATGGESLEHPFVLRGTMTVENLRMQEAFGYFVEHKFQTPGVATKYLYYASADKNVDAVFYQVPNAGPERCYYFDVTAVTITGAAPEEPRRDPKP